MNINQLFEQFVGTGTTASAPQGENAAQQDNSIAGMIGKLNAGAPGGFAGGLATGGLLGALMGNKKMRKKAGKVAGGALGYGGSAVLGALALKAYQNWQTNKSGTDTPLAQGHDAVGNTSVPTPTPESFDPALQEDASGQPLQIALVKAMIAAANADGHIDPQEQAGIFEAVDKMALDAPSKAMIFDVLRNPPDIAQIAGYATGLEQASEIYLASRLAIDPDQPSERRYLQDLANAMTLPDGLVHEIEAQFDPDPETGPGDQAGQFGRNGNRNSRTSVPPTGARQTG